MKWDRKFKSILATDNENAETYLRDFDHHFYGTYYRDLGHMTSKHQLADHYLKFGRGEGRFPNYAKYSAYLSQKGERPEVNTITLIDRAPSHQNALDLFAGKWLARIDEVYPGLRAGKDNYYRGDTRAAIAARHLGYVPGSFHGMSILELGPMEGMHTYQIANLGASNIVSVEANSNAFLRCLIAKEILNYRCTFLLGDALLFLQENTTRYDLIFCSGILYHMENPYALIKALSERTDRVFLWTHYFDPSLPKGPGLEPKEVEFDGVKMTYYVHRYNVDLTSESFWGGNKETSAWLTKDTIIMLFQRFGFELTIHHDDRSMDVGCHITATARRA